MIFYYVFVYIHIKYIPMNLSFDASNVQSTFTYFIAFDDYNHKKIN